MTDRLPAPIADAAGAAPLVERASATSARAMSWTRKFATTGGLGDASPTKPLRDVEEELILAITGPEIAADQAAPRLTAGPRLSARERLEIYRFGYRARLVECLDDDYPILARTLGAEGFESLALQYLDRFPSTSPNLNAFGRHMSALCKDAKLGEFDSAREFLSELARLEWAMVELIHAREPSPLDLTALAAIPVDGFRTARLMRSDTIRLLRFTYPVNSYYQACRTHDTPPPIPSPSNAATAAYRTAWRLWRMDLTPAMTRVLAALLDGVPIEESLGRMGIDEADPKAVAEAGRSVMVWFKEWVQSGFFCELVLPNRS